MGQRCRRIDGVAMAKHPLEVLIVSVCAAEDARPQDGQEHGAAARGADQGQKVSDNLMAQAELYSMSMDIRSSGAILRILNRIALVDGHLSPEEEHLLDSLAQQYKLQAKIVSWEQELADPSRITALASIVAPEHHALLLKTAYMVAGIARDSREDTYIGTEEDALLKELESVLSLTAAERATARQQATAELERQPSLWQVLYACFGSQFEWPLLG